VVNKAIDNSVQTGMIGQRSTAPSPPSPAHVRKRQYQIWLTACPHPMNPGAQQTLNSNYNLMKLIN